MSTHGKRRATQVVRKERPWGGLSQSTPSSIWMLFQKLDRRRESVGDYYGTVPTDPRRRSSSVRNSHPISPEEIPTPMMNPR